MAIVSLRQHLLQLLNKKVVQFVPHHQLVQAEITLWEWKEFFFSFYRSRKNRGINDIRKSREELRLQVVSEMKQTTLWRGNKENFDSDTIFLKCLYGLRGLHLPLPLTNET